MFVEDRLEAARARLVTITDDAKLIEVARLLTSGTDLVVVCVGAGVLQGVVTKTDVVRQISLEQDATFQCLVSTMMTRDVVLCRGSDRLEDASERMKARHLKTIPVVDEDNRPLGVLTARAVLRVLLGEVEDEGAQMVDYVTGVGYR